MFEIQKGVAKPETLSHRIRPREAKYPFASMEVNDYFEVPSVDSVDVELEGEERSKKLRERVNASARAYALRADRERGTMEGPDRVRFTVAVLENGNIGVWRDS